MKSIDYRKIITEVCRIILGLTFIFSGAVKAIDPVGGAIKMEDYFAAFGLSALEPIALFSSINLAALEFLLGLCLLMGVYRKFITSCTLVLMIFMTILTLYLAIFNPVHDCGCFGEAIIITNWQTFYKNLLILLPASIITFIYHNKITPLYTAKVQWFILFFAYAFPVGFAYYNYYHQPIIDFRPFKIGANIPELMSFPENAPVDEYQYIYQKNGESKAFTPETAPAGDSTWTFVEAKLVKQGYVPPINSFDLYDKNEYNIAEEILADSNGVFLLIAPKLEKANDTHIDEINNLYNFAHKRKLSFFCVTSSGDNEIKTWIDDTGAEYPFLTADEIMLKTMIRANPGVIILKSGTIQAKWNHTDIPSIKTADVVVEQLLHSPENNNTKKEMNTWILIICCFTLPLLCVWIYDYFRNRK